MYIRRDDGNQWIDAQWLAGKLFRDGHVAAMANDRAGWLCTPIKEINSDVMYEWVSRFLPEEPGMYGRKSACNVYHWELKKELQIGWVSSI